MQIPHKTNPSHNIKMIPPKKTSKTKTTQDPTKSKRFAEAQKALDNWINAKNINIASKQTTIWTIEELQTILKNHV